MHSGCMYGNSGNYLPILMGPWPHPHPHPPTPNTHGHPPNELLQHMALALVHHSRCGHVPQQVLRVYLDGGQVRGGHEEIQQVVLAILVVPEHVQGPMQQPCALLQLHQGWRKGLIVDGVPQFVDVLTRGLKVLHQDVGAQLAPQRGHVALAAGAQRAVWLQQIRCHAVVAALKLELGIQVQGLHVLRANGEVLLQELQSMGERRREWGGHLFPRQVQHEWSGLTFPHARNHSIHG
eukprot:1157467-Pelagomonas_calceolata.AAC.4